MDWIESVFLALGIGIGFGGGWWARSRRTDPSAEVPSISNSKETQEVVTHPAQRSQLLEKLKKTEIDYRLASQMCQFKGGFLSRISHELRSPLNGLIGIHQLILSDLCEDTTEERQFLQQANTSVHKMIQMLDRIIEVSRTEAGRHPLQSKPLQLVEVFEEVHYLTELQAANRNIPLKICTPDPKICVLADRRCLIQVLVNFIDIAITPTTNGSIRISADTALASPSTNGKASGGYVQISIDLPLRMESLQEPVDFLQQEPDSNSPCEANIHLSTSTILLMNQTLLELMNGSLEIIDSAPPPSEFSAEDESEMVRLQCWLPLAPHE